MDCFIKKIFKREFDEEVHSQFVRFGKGKYEGRAKISLIKTSKIKLKGSFESANDFVLLVSELEDIRFSGIILSREKLNLENEKKKAGLYQYEVSGLKNEKIREIKDKVYCFLLDGEGIGIILKIKKKLPKPGKSGEGKTDDKFCVLEADLKYYSKIKEAFFWDTGDCKKTSAIHTYIIDELIIPQNEKDPVQIRLKTKRKGKIVRKIEVDKKELIKEAELEA